MISEITNTLYNIDDIVIEGNENCNLFIEINNNNKSNLNILCDNNVLTCKNPKPISGIKFPAGIVRFRFVKIVICVSTF